MSEKENKPGWQLLVDVRKTLNGIWESPDVGFRGRCWGLIHRGGNTQKGSHITLGNEQSVVTIFQNPETGELEIHQFMRTEETPLGNKIRQALQDNKLI